MIIRRTLTLILLPLIHTLSAQHPATHPRLVSGVLDNGLHYYIYPTDMVKQQASYYLIQNAGSILETDKQQGLAHFLEHMAFNGTRHFPGKELLDYFEKHGASFGININAYTSFDETVYNLSGIPAHSDELIDQSLLTLYDWSTGLLLEEKEIDAERGVIVEEWRTRNTAGRRIYDAMLPILYNNTRYAHRTPIGSMEVVKNFSPEALRRFYRDWYRPDLQAVVVIGDIKPEEIAEKIKTRFSDIGVPEKAPERIFYPIPEHKETRYKMATDKEINQADISLVIRHPRQVAHPDLTQYLHREQLRELSLSMLNTRLDEMSKEKDCPFRSAYVYYGRLSPLTDQFGVRITPKPGRQQEAFKAVTDTYVIAEQHGFSLPETERAMTNMEAGFRIRAEKEDEMSHDKIEQRIQELYLYNTPFTSASVSLERFRELRKDVSNEEITEVLKQLFRKENRIILVTGVENENNLTEAEATQILHHSESHSWPAPEEDTLNTDLMEGITIVPGKITEETYLKNIDAYTFTLSNGWKVHYKFTDKNKGEVFFSAESDGGKSLYRPEDIPSANYSTVVAQASGVYRYSATDLNKLLAGKVARVALSVSETTEVITGYGMARDLETLFRLFYLQLNHPRFDREMYDQKIESLNDSYQKYYKKPRNVISDSLSLAVYDTGNPRFSLFDKNYIEAISFSRLQEIYHERFDALDRLEMFIIGDIEEETLKTLLEQYVASTPSSGRKEQWRDVSVPWKHKSLVRRIPVKMETPKSTVKMKFRNAAAYNFRNQTLIRYVADLLQLRLTNELREKQGGTYGASVSGSLSRRPSPALTLSVSFDCDPEKPEELIQIVNDEIDKIKSGNISDKELHKVISAYAKSVAQSKNYSHSAYTRMYTYIRDGYDLDSLHAAGGFPETVNKEEIKRFTRKFLNKQMKHYTLTFEP
ncbi:M16 family metallopeptidase [Sinomicrobium soli]|uniref:M16 family metallopeptidase n=1 Tax=Sinomicrobium sp. N-1-3-6 TaxID=2219864 RepID=UPI000DCE8916|nr:insulinase family protein [Sinomicrobium sp. N-1-3-6]RAV29086.1 insulinase family protein [Sinomicrobium sp. N-1-3-6]